MIKTLLVANRGEIACRIFRSASRMGIRTVAVYSDADAGAKHTRVADEAHHIGAAPSAESYLNIERILGVAKACGADAIHPGYGFLAENAHFARACAEAGISFIGPPAAAIEAMAIKGAAKDLMQKAGVPVLPGLSDVRAPDDLERITNQVGYPLLVKPAAGGGGKGMKIVERADELEAALSAAAREAASSFGDDRLIVERYLRRPRHIEVQVFADTQGNVIHLNERDCSLQRRHQKIIEEAPAPGMSESLREQMGSAAVAAASSIGYVGAGTIEFLLDDDDQFYFMEMNTRLQVEHPVTEMITGFDLVEWQLRVAAGETLPVDQSAVGVNGHAVEARLYAEDAANDFLPVAGRIEFLQLPDSDRIDSGFGEGDNVSVFYDPMLMKLIVHAPDRAQSLDRLKHLLLGTIVGGIKTNRDFLLRALNEPVLQEGRVWTSYLDTHSIYQDPTDAERHRLMAAAAIFLAADEPLPNFRLAAPHRNRLRVYHEQSAVDIDVEIRGPRWIIGLGNASITAVVSEKTGDRLVLEIAGERLDARVFEYLDNLLVVTEGHSIALQRTLPAALIAEETGSLRSPMSGKVVDLKVETGQQVNAGEALLVIEAMKMEHTIKAPTDGVVTAVHFQVGDVVADGVELVEIEESS